MDKVITLPRLEQALKAVVTDLNTQISSLQSQIDALNWDKTTVTLTKSGNSAGTVFFTGTALDFYIQADSSLAADISITKGSTVMNSGKGVKQVLYHETLTSAQTGSPTTLTYKATATKGGVAKSSNTISISIVNPIYIGSSTGSYTNIITDTNKQPAKTSPAGTYTVNVATAASYLYFIVPSQMTVNKVTMSGFDVPLNAADTTSYPNYKIYKSVNTYDAGALTLVVS